MKKQDSAPVWHAGPRGCRSRVVPRLARPRRSLRLIRLERARLSIECGATVTRAAEVAGFRSGLELRRAWNRQWGGSPRDAARAAVAS